MCQSDQYCTGLRLRLLLFRKPVVGICTACKDLTVCVYVYVSVYMVQIKQVYCAGGGERFTKTTEQQTTSSSSEPGCEERNHGGE